MMITIKRYPNRKLYDTEAKQYITLDKVAQLIRQGAEVTVIDNATGEDITALILTQIIVEQEKKQGGLLPRSVLAGLIQAGENRLSSFQQTLATPFSFIRQFEEEVKKRVQDLITNGDLTEREGQRLLGKLLDHSSTRIQDQYDEAEIERVFTKMQVPTRQDINQLSNQLDALAKKIDELTS